jgi:hypothetical protein
MGHQHRHPYPRWAEVLTALALQPVKLDFLHVIRCGSEVKIGGGGEGERHSALKRFVAQNPACIGLPKSTPVGKNEVPLASGDCLDVSFCFGDEWVAAEVKPALRHRRRRPRPVSMR